MAENTLAENIGEAIELVDNFRNSLSAYASSVVTPKGDISIRDYCFTSTVNIESVTISEGAYRLGKFVFSNCSALTTINLPTTLRNIGNNCFMNCTSLQEIEIPHGVGTLAWELFSGCTNLTTIFIPNTLTYISSYFPEMMFNNCTNLEDVVLENGFNCDNLYLSVSTKYSVETIVSWLNALADRTGQTAYTLIIGTTNLNKLTAEQKAIATNKNWNLS